MIDRDFWSFNCRGVRWALCGVLLLTAGCTSRRSEQHRGEGDTLFQLGRVEDARAAYLKAEETNPENPMAQMGLARCAAATGDLETALALLEKARQLDPALEESYMETVRLLVEADRLDDAITAAEAYARISLENGELLLSAVLLKAKRAEEAITHLEVLRQKLPDSPEVLLNLGVAYAQAGKTEDSIGLLKPLAQGNSPFASAAQMALIDIYRAGGRTAELVTEFEALAAAQPENTDVQLGYARSLLLADRTQDAEGIARAVLEKDPASGWANYIIGALKLKDGSLEEAVAFLEDAAKALPQETEVIQLLDLARNGGVAAEPATTPGAAPAEPHTAPAATLTWRDLWRQAALKRLLENREDFLAEGGSEAREVLALAALFTQNGTLARELAGALPEDSAVGGYFKALETRDAAQIASFFEAWKPEEPEIQLMRDNALGFAMAAGGSRGQALSVFLLCLEHWPDNAVALYNIAQVFRALGQPAVAAQQLQRIIVNYPENIDAHQMLYASLREGGKLEEARRAAEASFTLFPEEKWSFLYLSQSYLDTGDPELALQVLNRATTLFPGDPELGLAVGGILVRLGDCEQARKTLDGIVTTAPGIIGGRAALVALCDVKGGDWTTVAGLASQVEAAQRPVSLALLASLAFLDAGDADAAQAALRPGSDGIPLRGTLGKILVAAMGGAADELGDEERDWAAKLTADRELLREYVTVASLQAAQLHDDAWTFYTSTLAKRPPHIAMAQLAFASLTHCKKVADIKAEGTAIAEGLRTDARAWIGLAQVMADTGNTDAQAAALAAAVQAGPEHPEAWFRNAVMLEKKGDFAGAVASYRKLLELQPDSPAANNNLAYMLLRSGGSDQEALEKATVAAEKLPSDPGVLHTLGLAQMRTENLEASKSSLARATEIDPANPTIMFDYGRLLQKLGNTEDARKRVQFALAMSDRAGIEFPERADAESFLADLQ